MHTFWTTPRTRVGLSLTEGMSAWITGITILSPVRAVIIPILFLWVRLKQPELGAFSRWVAVAPSAPLIAAVLIGGIRPTMLFKSTDKTVGNIGVALELHSGIRRRQPVVRKYAWVIEKKNNNRVDRHSLSNWYFFGDQVL